MRNIERLGEIWVSKSDTLKALIFQKVMKKKLQEELGMKFLSDGRFYLQPCDICFNCTNGAKEFCLTAPRRVAKYERYRQWFLE